MSIVKLYVSMLALTARFMDAMQPIAGFCIRTYVAWQFLISGWLKVTSFDNTLFLFKEEYRVPILPPDLAAVMGTAGELGFSILLILGIAGRLSAMGLFFVNLMAVVSYAHVLLSDGFEAALAQHYLWGFMLLVSIIYGPGRISFDEWLARSLRMPGATMVGNFARA